MRRFLFALVTLAGCGLLLAGSSTAAFPGTNGKIVFAGSTDPTGGIKEDVFVINADGTGLSQLTHDVTLDRMPVFSPSGQEIAFTRENRGGNLQIYVMNADGSGATTNGMTSSPRGRPTADGSRSCGSRTCSTPARSTS